VASEESLAIRVLALFQSFRKTPWFRVTYIVLLGLIVALMDFLTTSAVSCFVVLLMPVVVFIFPYWFGERKVRRFAVNAVPIFLIAILLAAAISTQTLVSQDRAIPLRSFPEIASPTMALSNGTVVPYRGTPAQPFTFHVKLTTTVNGTATGYAVYVNLTILHGLTPQAVPGTLMTPSPGNLTTNTKNGTWYETTENLTDAVYGYAFSVWDKRANWTYSSGDIGPLTAPWGTFYGLILEYTALSMTLPLAFYYVILFMWWYTIRARELRTRDLGGTLEIPKEKPRPKEGSADQPEPAEKATKAAAFTCTNCGADVGEEDEKCPKCGAVFET
jgi:hypothetical protein